MARLQEYKSKLIVFPRHSTPKQVFGGKSPVVEATREQAEGAQQFKGTVMPVSQPAVEFPFAAVNAEANQYSTLRIERNEKRMKGIRAAMKKAKEEEEAQKKK